MSTIAEPAASTGAAVAGAPAAAVPVPGGRRTAASDRYWSREETLPRDQLRALQQRLFLEQVAYAWHNVGWYRDAWRKAGVSLEQIRGLDDIARLPFVTKADIRQSQADAPPYGLLLADSLSREDIVRVAATSGTTGTPVRIPFTTADYDWWMEGVVRALWAAGVRRGDVLHAAFGFTPFIGLFGAHDAAERWIGATVIPGGAWDSAARIKALQDFGVTTLLGTPTYLLRLGRLVAEAGHDVSTWPLKRLFVTGEPGPASSPATGERLRALWKVPVHEFCGTQETNYFAFSGEHGAFHWNEDLVYPEVLDPRTGEPVPPGEPGLLVVTDLRQRTHPLIRFPTGDLVHGFGEAPAGAGRTFLHFKGFIGRVDDVVKIRGVSVSQPAIEHVLRSHPETSDHYEIEFSSDSDGLDQARVRVEPRQSLGGDEARRVERELTAAFKRELSVAIDVELVALSSLPRFELKASRIRDLRRR